MSVWDIGGKKFYMAMDQVVEVNQNNPTPEWEVNDTCRVL